MLDFDIHRFSRRCCETDHELKPGDAYYSALIQQGAKVVRKDFSESSWSGAPEGTVGWWKSRVPDTRSHRMHWAPNDVILHYFEQLEGNPSQQDTRYVLALLMIRRRIVRLEETVTNEQGATQFALYCPRNEREYVVDVLDPSSERIGQIQQELADLLETDSD